MHDRIGEIGLEPEAFRAERRLVARGMAAGAAFIALVFMAAWASAPYWLPDLALPQRRLLWILALEPLVLFWLAAGVADVARRRFVSSEDILAAADKGAPGAGVRTAAAILQNTLEQVVLAVAAHVCFAVGASGRSMALVPAAITLFCIGRALFWARYEAGAGARAFGFVLSFYPSVVLLAAAILLLLAG